MAMRMLRCTAAVFLLMAVIPTSCNTNKKYVKSEVIEGRNLHNTELEDLCELGSFDSAGKQKAMFVEDLNLMPPAEMLRSSAERFVGEEEKKPRAVMHGLERTLVGSGSHREVHSAIAVELDLGVEASEMSIAENCELLILEHLSTGVFADPFQLHRLQQQQQAFKYAHIYGDVDLERPAKNSFQSIVELRQRLVPDKKDGLEVLYRSEVTLPLHARYPPTSSESHSVVNISVPHVLIYCKGGDIVTGTSAKLKQELCIYAELGDTLASIPAQLLQWSIPSGYPAHLAWVGRLTTSAGLAGVAAIYMASKFSGLKHNSQ